MDEKIIKALKSLGLNEKELKLYLEMLSIGTQPASILARKLNLPRSSVQFLAESLAKKSIVRKHKHKNVTKYQPVAPENLLRLLESQKSRFLAEMNKKLSEMEEAVPSMQQLRKHELSRPQVGFYEGVEGIKMIYEDALFASEPVRSLANFEERNKHLPGYFDNYYIRRKKKKIFVKAIYPDTSFGRLRQARDFEDYRESRLVDAKQYQWLPEIQFYDDKVAIASANEKIGVIIESKEITEAMKVLFDLAWLGAEKSKKGKA